MNPPVGRLTLSPARVQALTGLSPDEAHRLAENLREEVRRKLGLPSDTKLSPAAENTELELDGLNLEGLPITRLRLEGILLANAVFADETVDPRNGIAEMLGRLDTALAVLGSPPA